MSIYHIAQINVARMQHALDHSTMAGFVAQLDTVNRMADKAPGFVWRLQGETGDATDVQVFDDHFILINMSVWVSIETLHDFVYRGQHLNVLRQRKQWFKPMTEMFTALWWVPANHIPTPEEGKSKLETLRRLGPTAEVFTFKYAFSTPKMF